MCVHALESKVQFCQVSTLNMFLFGSCLNKKPSLFNQGKEGVGMNMSKIKQHEEKPLRERKKILQLLYFSEYLLVK